MIHFFKGNEAIAHCDCQFAIFVPQYVPRYPCNGCGADYQISTTLLDAVNGEKSKCTLLNLLNFFVALFAMGLIIECLS